jgi:hypothetical protein
MMRGWRPPPWIMVRRSPPLRQRPIAPAWKQKIVTSRTHLSSNATQIIEVWNGYPRALAGLAAGSPEWRKWRAWHRTYSSTSPFLTIMAGTLPALPAEPRAITGVGRGFRTYSGTYTGPGGPYRGEWPGHEGPYHGGVGGGGHRTGATGPEPAIIYTYIAMSILLCCESQSKNEKRKRHTKLYMTL